MGGGNISSSNSYTGIPAIEITKDAQSVTGVGYMCGDDDGDADYMVDTTTNPNMSSNARRRSTVTDISSYDHSPPERQQQQVSQMYCTYRIEQKHPHRHTHWRLCRYP